MLDIPEHLRSATIWAMSGAGSRAGITTTDQVMSAQFGCNCHCKAVSRTGAFLIVVHPIRPTVMAMATQVRGHTHSNPININALHIIFSTVAVQFLVNRLVHHHLPPAEQKLWKNCCLNCNNPPTYNLSEKNCFRLKLNGIKAATATAAPPPPTLGDIYRLLTAATLASLHHHLRSSHAADKMVTGSRDVHTTTGERYRH